MPDFENIDQYEAKNPESGRKKIVPIAPHSMQAVDYRPVKRTGEQPEARKSSPPYRKVHVEPVSIRQMEKEFRQAARIDAKRRGRTGLGGLIKALKEFLAGLFGKKKRNTRRSRNQRESGQRNRRRPKGNRKDRAEGGPSQEKGKGRSSGRKPRKRNRSNKSKQDSQNQEQGNNQKKQGDGSKSRNRSRGKRRNRRPQGQRQGSKQGGGQPRDAKPSNGGGQSGQSN